MPTFGRARLALPPAEVCHLLKKPSERFWLLSEWKEILMKRSYLSTTFAILSMKAPWTWFRTSLWEVQYICNVVIYLFFFQNTGVGVRWLSTTWTMLYRLHSNDKGRSCKRKLNTGDVITGGRLRLLKLSLWNYSLSELSSALISLRVQSRFLKEIFIIKWRP